MNICRGFLAVSALLLGVGAALAGPSGQYESLLLRTLMANAAGECPAATMGDSLRQSCDSQITDVRDQLTKLGPIVRVAYLGTGDIQAGKPERYTVFFEHGEWDWNVSAQRDGRLQFANAPHPPHFDIGSYSRSN